MLGRSLENPVDRGAWWAAVHTVTQSRTWLKWLSMHACIGEGNGNPLQYSCLENPRDRGAWWAAIYRVKQSQTRLKRFSSSSIEFCQENAMVIANILFQQHKRRLYTWTSPNGQHQNQTDYVLCSQRWRSSIQSTKTRPGADCGSDHELLIAKFRLKLKKVGKTTRPFRYDLNQIPYDYIQWKWEIDLRDEIW